MAYTVARDTTLVKRPAETNECVRRWRSNSTSEKLLKHGDHRDHRGSEVLTTFRHWLRDESDFSAFSVFPVVSVFRKRLSSFHTIIGIDAHPSRPGDARFDPLASPTPDTRLAAAVGEDDRGPDALAREPGDGAAARSHQVQADDQVRAAGGHQVPAAQHQMA